RSFANSLDSRVATVQPATQRLKTSMTVNPGQAGREARRAGRQFVFLPVQPLGQVGGEALGAVAVDFHLMQSGLVIAIGTRQATGHRLDGLVLQPGYLVLAD
ncbi:MAG TPA: hypothetical protein VES73_12105, partial [Lamprocystis sp. (in: g-proteobacteria)]|nr:hypothetical protein [Lamprocystis sp. (in: g-proteobacteria)]